MLVDLVVDEVLNYSFSTVSALADLRLLKYLSVHMVCKLKQFFSGISDAVLVIVPYAAYLPSILIMILLGRYFSSCVS